MNRYTYSSNAPRLKYLGESCALVRFMELSRRPGESLIDKMQAKLKADGIGFGADASKTTLETNNDPSHFKVGFKAKYFGIR